MRKIITLLTLLLVCCSISAQRAHSVDMSRIGSHPRILMFKGEEAQIKQLIKSDQGLMKIHKSIISYSDKLRTTPVLERKMTGKRLLDVSRAACRSIFFLSYSYRLTGNIEYAHRAQAEMLAVARFSDWNPSHFLDVGEMTMAMAIGYDWLFDVLSDDSRDTIREAIVEKGICESMKSENSQFLKAKNNWNQVCNAGITYGALAVAQHEPQLARQMIERAVNNIYMDDYSPDGVYPEGANYWGYGTSFNVMFLSAVEKVFGTDFELSKTKGFDKTASYMQSMIAPDGRYFNYSDSPPSGRGGLNITLFWFAQKFNDLSVLFLQKDILAAKETDFSGNRLLPAIMIWAKGIDMKNVSEPVQKMFNGQGKAPVSLMRSSWSDPKSIYLGYKMGSGAVSHSHMDIGSFIMVANGVRWACDLGMQEYESLESKGIDLWNRTQDSQRWRVFRYNNMAHNTLTFDNKLQNVVGYAKLDKSYQDDNIMFAISDLTDIYKDQVASVSRGVAIVDKQYVVVRDEIKTLDAKSTVRWNMVTGAKVTTLSENTAILEAKNGERLLVRIDSPSGAKIRTWSAQSPNEWDTANDGKIFIGFEYEAQPQSSITLQVSLIPSVEKERSFKFSESLSNWENRQK